MCWLPLYTLLCDFFTLIINNHNYYNSIYKPNLQSHKKQGFDKYNEPYDINKCSGTDDSGDVTLYIEEISRL